MAELADTILENAQGPLKASTDAGSVEQRSIADLILADQYLKNETAVDLPRRGVRFNKLVPPGTA